MDENGVWRTVNGRHIFIKDGETITDAYKKANRQSVIGIETSDGVKIKSFSQHFKDRKKIRTVGQKNIIDSLRNPIHIEKQKNGRVKYIGKKATTVVGKNTIVTVWATKKSQRNKYGTKQSSQKSIK